MVNVGKYYSTIIINFLLAFRCANWSGQRGSENPAGAAQPDGRLRPDHQRQGTGSPDKQQCASSTLKNSTNLPYCTCVHWTSHFFLVAMYNCSLCTAYTYLLLLRFCVI